MAHFLWNTWMPITIRFLQMKLCIVTYSDFVMWRQDGLIALRLDLDEQFFSSVGYSLNLLENGTLGSYEENCQVVLIVI